jgi:outer membrane protein OmpA-like peptidoglycan-associated protein
MQTAIGTVLGGLAAKSEETGAGALRKVLDLAPAGAGDVSWPNIASASADPASPLMSTGRRMLSGLFGNSETAIAHTLGTETGLPSGSASSLLAMAAPMVLSYFTRRVRTEGLTTEGLGGLLQREVPAIRTALPPSLANLIWHREREAIPATRPVVQQTMTAERASGRWVLPLILLACIPALWWLVSHQRRPVVVIPHPGVGTANRIIPEAPQAALPSGLNLYFDTASNRLRPDSQARLHDFAVAVQKSNPNVRVTVKGFTDNVGNAGANMRLSQARANAVMGDLQHEGIPQGEITAQGFGEDNPIADNATPDGRAQNRRVEVGVAP